MKSHTARGMQVLCAFSVCVKERRKAARIPR